MNTNSPTNSTLALCVLGALSGVASTDAAAFQLGQLQEASRIGAPLDAYINVLMSPSEAKQSTQIDVVPDFTYREDPAMNAALSSIRAEMVRTEYGHHYIKLTSDRDLNVPLLAFRIKATNGDSVLIRRFTLSPKPAVPAIVQQPRSLGRSRDSYTRNISQSKAMTAFTAEKPGQQLIDTTSEYGPVKAGDTLWKIATQVAGNKAGAILNDIFELNPHAFIDGDINKLRQGVTLRLPGSSAPSTATLDADSFAATNVEPDVTETIETPQAQAPAEAAIATNETFDNAADVDFMFDDQIAEAEDSATNAAEFIELPESSADTNASTSAQASVDWQSQNPELADRLQALGEKYAALRARYAEQQATQLTSGGVVEESAPQGTLMAEVASATSDGAIAEESATTASGNAEGDSTSVIDGAIDVSAEAPLVTSAATEPRFPLPFWMLGLIGLAVLVTGATLYLYHVRRTVRKQLKEQMARNEKDNSLKEELAKKAQHRIKMEGEVERMLHEKTDDALEEEHVQTMQLQVEEVLPVEAEEVELEEPQEDSPEHQINDSIAHGRYGEAEELLREVINNSSRNYSAKLRLAEVYYITERIGEFVEISQDIHANHRAEISDEDWRRVMRMGKMIAPEQPPFSGPQSISEQASAG